MTMFTVNREQQGPLAGREQSWTCLHFKPANLWRYSPTNVYIHIGTYIYMLYTHTHTYIYEYTGNNKRSLFSSNNQTTNHFPIKTSEILVKLHRSSI